MPTNIVSPINVNNLLTALTHHPDKKLVQYLINGFQFGFDIGFSGHITHSLPKNLLSARNNPEAVNNALTSEIERGHTSGPFTVSPFNTLHCSPLGAVPKKDGTHRIILDLSSPRNNSVNMGIDHDEFSVKYTPFDEAVDLIRNLGLNCEMGKMDVKHAFRLCPVRPQDWPLLGMCWNNYFYIDTRLPFGSRSSPFIFNTFADALTWILINFCAIPYILHYLDDFILAHTHNLKTHMNTMESVFKWLGVPLATDKAEGPTTKITYLGIDINSSNFTISLPSDKLSDLKSILTSWSTRHSCTKRELLSLIGKLSFAAKVVKPGRMFLRRLIHLSTSVNRLHYHIHFNKQARLDIIWWHHFISSWNGISIIQDQYVDAEQINLFTDASNLGFGAVFGNFWFSKAWPPEFKSHHINVKELFAIVAAIFTWGHRLHNKQIILYTDNLSICAVWKSTSSKDSDLMFYIRHLFFFCANRNINLLVKHIPGHDNVYADLLSRLQVHQFHQLLPSAHQLPCNINPTIWNLSSDI